jgi:hypothetical protein
MWNTSADDGRGLQMESVEIVHRASGPHPHHLRFSIFPPLYTTPLVAKLLFLKFFSRIPNTMIMTLG